MFAQIVQVKHSQTLLRFRKECVYLVNMGSTPGQEGAKLGTGAAWATTGCGLCWRNFDSTLS